MPTADQLKRAIQIQEQIAKLEEEMKAVLNGVAVAAPVKAEATIKPAKKKGGMSAAGRSSIVAAQKARWAKIKAEAPKPAAVEAKPSAVAKPLKEPKTKAPAAKKKVKRTMSPEARAKISAAAKKRWAKKKG